MTLVRQALTTVVLCALCVPLLYAQTQKKQQPQQQPQAQQRVDPGKAYSIPELRKAAESQISRPQQPAQQAPSTWNWGGGDAQAMPQRPQAPAQQSWNWGQAYGGASEVGKTGKIEQNSYPGWNWRADGQDRKTHPAEAVQQQKKENRPPGHHAENNYGPVYQIPHPDRPDHHQHHAGCGHDNGPTYYYDFNYYQPAPEYYAAPPPVSTQHWDWDDDYEYDRRYPAGPHLTGQIVDAEIWAADGTFLGIVSPSWEKYESIRNPNGPYGSPYSRTSILNPRSPYGAARGPLSPWCPETRTPPRLFWHGQFVGYLTANRDLYPRTGPGWIMKRWFANTPFYR